jgi:hypothetical protein
LFHRPSFRQPVQIIASVAEDIEYFFIFVTSKGVLLESRRVYLDEDGDPDYNYRTVEFSIDPDFTYAPVMKVYAYYYKKAEAQFLNANLYVQFKNELPNYVSLISYLSL